MSAPSPLSVMCSFLRGAERKATTLGVFLQGSWVGTLKDVATRRPHRQCRSLQENVCQMNIDSRRRKDGLQSHQESSGNNREQPLGGNDVRRKPKPLFGHRKKTRLPQNCSAGAQIESRILDKDPGVFHSFTAKKCRFFAFEVILMTLALRRFYFCVHFFVKRNSMRATKERAAARLSLS